MLNVDEGDFEVLERIGRGTFGEVFKARAKDTGVVCVIKRVDLADLPLEEKEDAENEVAILAQLHHPHVIQYFGSYTTASLQLNIVMEFADRQSLYHRIHAQKAPFEEEYIWKILLQTSLALLYIHQQNILHRDIKTANVFLATDPFDGGDVVKLGDFGVAKHVLSKRSLIRTIIGTPYYLSPEICLNRPYGERSDVWALGVVLYEMCMLRHPFEATNQGSLVLKIIRGKYTPVGAPYSSRLSHICSMCLATETSKRPTVLELLSHPTMMRKAGDILVPLPPEVCQAHHARLALHTTRCSAPPQPTHSPTATSLPACHDALSCRSSGSFEGDDRGIIYITATDVGQSKAGLPRYNREAIELRKPGGHIQNRRVRAKKQALSSTAPISPTCTYTSAAPISRSPFPKQAVQRDAVLYRTAAVAAGSHRPPQPKGKVHSVRTVRSPDTGVSTRPVQTGYGAPTGRPQGKLEEEGNSRSQQQQQQHVNVRSAWNKAARYMPINLNDTSTLEEKDQTIDTEVSCDGGQRESPQHREDPAEHHTEGGWQEEQPLRAQWQHPEATLQYPEVLATLQGTLRVPEEVGLDTTDGALSPGRQTPCSELNGSIQEEASLREKPAAPADSDAEPECSAGEVEEELVEPSTTAKGHGGTGATGWGSEEEELEGWAREEDTVDSVQQQQQLRADAEQIRQEGEGLVGPEAFLDIYRKVSCSEMEAEAMQRWIEDRLCASRVSEDTMAAVVQRVYQLMALEAAMEDQGSLASGGTL
eukprot:GGOE01015015.1.p1 GENE.GGOE01015015.1~~GGOE01015015.1.p1  ORF type:complete len:786 (+),score=208.71 GGOE01015015.1:78-2360(+)